MLRSPLRTRFDRFFGIAARERTRRSRGFGSGFAQGVERLEGRALLSTVTVHVGNNFFSPSSVTVHPGDTVHWVFDEGVHSSTSVAGLSEEWDSDVITTPGETFDHTFTNLGSFAYYCTVHGFDQGGGRAGGMAGTIIVKNDVPLRSIRVTPAVASLLTPGGTQQFTATGVFGDGSTEDITSSVSWSTVRPNVATVSAAGKASAVSKGVGIVIARKDDAAGVGVVVVQAPAPTFLGAQRVTSGQGRKQKVIGFDLKFSAPLNVPMAQMAGHYQVVQAGQGRRPVPVNVPVLSAQYNSAANTVRLILGKFKANKPLTLTAAGLVGANGTPIARIVTPI